MVDIDPQHDVGEIECRLEEPVSFVLDGLRERDREVIVALLEQRKPELLASFRAEEEPTLQQQDEMIDLLGDAFSENLGPGHLPTERGVEIDNALGAFLTRWPSEALEPGS
ncbi:hypothetical protein [Antrihabitans cavernicola]|uniref:Uncharacterized protein n=1 Tax=Antrihabitans cavernicola TaxID=2495913 RepID=A0A5A7SFS1_9NOCA|nr:hypothetical protein [Spelaeibacter cavernicola]KAA0024980.1 hypothetical protein FOY51_03445 [Spelaeibacter cavernicola]